MSAPLARSTLGGASHFAQLEEALPEELVPDFLARLCYASEALVAWELDDGRADRVRFTLDPAAGADPAAVAALITEVARRMVAGYRPVEPVVLIDRGHRPVPHATDPQPALLASGELLDLGAGRRGLGPHLTLLIEAIDTRLGRLAADLGASPYRFPSLIGADVLARCHYLSSFPHSLTLVTHLRKDLAAIEEFARQAARDGGPLACDPALLAPIHCLLAPTVCFHCYAWLADRRLTAPLTLTASGRCFRWESANLSGLERLWDFGMREVIFLGSREQAIDGRERGIEAAAALLDEWGLAYRIERANDPFFIEGYSSQRVFQAAFELKFELVAPLPYRAGPGLAVGSFNYHQDFFGRTLGISDAQGEPVHTACIGFGLERLALAVVSQYGPDPAGWPAELAPATAAAGRDQGVTAG